MDNKLKETQHQQETQLQKSISDINVILTSIKEQCGKSEWKQITPDQQKLEREIKQLGDKVSMLQKSNNELVSNLSVISRISKIKSRRQVQGREAGT